MNKTKKRRLERAGWRVGDVSDFLSLEPQERFLIEMKIALAQMLRQQRKAREMTQAELASLLGSSQSRVAKMEAADASVTTDLLINALGALNVSGKELSVVVAGIGKASKPVAVKTVRGSGKSGKKVTKRA